VATITKNAQKEGISFPDERKLDSEKQDIKMPPQKTK
jgi:hypothetical protein